MGSTRIKGRQLSLKIGTPATDMWADTTSVVLDREEAEDDVVTFEDASQPGGAQQEFLQITAIQSTDPEGLWGYCWEHTGEEIAFTFAPHGNETPSATQPHFLGTCRIGPRPAIGGEAGRNNTWTFETRWDVVGTVVKDTGE